MTDLARALVTIQGLATKVEANLDAVLDALHDARLGQPRAAHHDGDGSGGELWCEEHERTVAECRAADDLCDGVLVAVVDPTGEAAVRTDRAELDRRRLTKAVTAALRALEQADNIRQRWAPPTTKVAPTLNDADLDLIWCVSCKRNAGHCEPVSEHYPGKGLCRWCANFARTYGGYPPLPILRKRHAGRNVTVADIGKAMLAGPKRVG